MNNLICLKTWHPRRDDGHWGLSDEALTKFYQVRSFVERSKPKRPRKPKHFGPQAGAQ